MNDQQYYANIYVKRKNELLPLMEQFYGPLPVNATHAELIGIYIGLLKNADFIASVDSLGYSNAVDPVSAIADAAGKIAGMFSGQVRTAKIQADAQSDAALSELILAQQGKDNTGKILLFSGLAVVVVGAIITVIILKRRK